MRAVAKLCVRRSDRRSRATALLGMLMCVLISGCGTAGSPRGAVMQVRQGTSRSVATPLEGTNLDYSGVAEPYGKTSVMDAVTSLSPGTIRYPGGAISNYWEWQTGSVNQPAATQQKQSGGTEAVPARQRTYGFTLSTLRQLTGATGAIPIFDLNVMTSTLPDQLQMLRTAAQMGIPVRYVELGNEFYLPISNYLQAFPTATSYANLVASWAPAIRAAFPKAQIAAVASALTATARERRWNSTVLSIAGSDINAVTLHDYPVARTSAKTLPSPASLLAGASLEWRPVESIINSLPSQLSVWLTEYNLSIGDCSLGSPALGTTWEHALYVAELDMQELASPRVTLTDYWDLFGHARTAQFTATTPPVATPTGSASQLIDQAMKGATAITGLMIANDPVLDGSARSVTGVEVTAAPGGDRLIFVNLGSTPATVPTGELIHAGASVEQLSGTLSMQAVQRRSVRVAGDLMLPSYSVTVVST